MSSQRTSQTAPDPTKSPTNAIAPPSEAAATTLTPDQRERWAQLIADGAEQFPQDLSPADRDWMVTAVQHRRRTRLIRHIARTVALDLRDTMRQKRGEQC